MPLPGPTDSDLPLDGTNTAPDVTSTNESAPDQVVRIADENGGTTGTAYTVQPGRRMERDGVILEAGVTVQFRTDETAQAAALIANGTIA